MKPFELISDITEIETIAIGSAIRDLVRLRKQYGSGRWRKVKGIAMIRLRTGRIRRAELHGMKLTALAEKNSSVNAIWIEPMKAIKHLKARFAICVENSEYPASLELHKVYRVIPDEDARKDEDLRIIDESGEDYLYPADYFLLIDIPRGTAQSLHKSFTRRAHGASVLRRSPTARS